MIKRWIKDNLTEQLANRRGVNLAGARQVGKSTLSQMLDLKAARRCVLDDESLRAVAMSDPHGFVRRSSGETLILDEIQKVPTLFDAIKMEVDRDNSCGQYLITGSANLRFAKTVRDSLAGRLATVRLRTLAQGEIVGAAPAFLGNAFKRDFKDVYELWNKRDVLHFACRGGYPESLNYSDRVRRGWYRDYLNDLLLKDIQDIAEVRKTDVLRDIVLWLLAHSSQFFSMDELSSKCDASRATVEDYIAALSALYLFDRLPAWSKSDYGFLGKRPKWMAADSGLVANLLGWDENALYEDGERNGHFLETWAYHQLATMADVDGRCALYHYRDNRKREIDFMVERDGGELLGVEVKAGAVSPEDFATLRWFGENLAKGPFTGIVLYSGERTLKFGEGLYAVPLSALGGE